MTAMAVLRGPMTAEEWCAIPELPWGSNLVDGEPIVNQPLPDHQVFVGNIFAALRSWSHEAAGRGLAIVGSIDVSVDSISVYEPDVLWYSEERRIHDFHKRPQPLPDLAIEVRSPSTWRYDIGRKKDRYEELGVAELWLVDHPVQTIIVFRRSSAAAPRFDVSLELAPPETLTSPLLPGFALPMANVFELR